MIDVQLFEVEDGLSSEMTVLLNQRLKVAQLNFTRQLEIFKFHQDSVQERMQLLDRINRVKHTELTYDYFVSSLAQQVKMEVAQTRTLKVLEPIAGHNMDTDRANLIWKCLIKHFGQDFFLESIEREYGISPEGNK